MSHVNWPALMRAGMRDLRLEPDVFWALTPMELMLILGLGSATAPLTRSGLERLIAAFPDEPEGKDHG